MPALDVAFEPPPTPTPTAPPTPTPTEPPPTPTPTAPPTPTPDPTPSFLPPVSPHETPFPLGEIETPPPPPPPPTQSPGFVPSTPGPSPEPLAPLTTPAPRPQAVEEEVARENPGDGLAPWDDSEPPRQLVDLTGAGAPGGGDGDAARPSVLANTVAKLARTAGEAVKKFAFPLSLTILVLIFLLIQGEIDRRDPKLAFAPVDSSKDMVFFE
ncbi:MAG TPA: hypothetical protein VHI71_10495 [Actinomycetota bacterium]|nr:hypothetical protein [Actinomycetota bacterium]